MQRTKIKTLNKNDWNNYSEEPVYKVWVKSLIKVFTKGVWSFGFGLFFSLRKNLTDKWLVYDDSRSDWRFVWLKRR